MQSNKYSLGIIGVRSEVEVTNRQNCVEYKTLSGYCSEEEVRSTVGNFGSGTYSFYYDGYYFNRKQAIQRLECDIEYAEKHLSELKFALKVTKKKSWIEVK